MQQVAHHAVGVGGVAVLAVVRLQRAGKPQHPGGVHHAAGVGVAGLQQAHREDRPLQHPADDHEGMPLVAPHALVEDSGDRKAGPPDHQQHLVEPGRSGVGVAEEREPQVQAVGLLPQLDRYPVPDRPQVLAHRDDGRDHRPGIVGVGQQEGHQLRLALQRSDGLQLVLQSEGPDHQLALGAGLAGAQVGDRVGRVVEAPGRGLGPLQVSAHPQQRLGVTGQNHGAPPHESSGDGSAAVMAFRGPGPRCPWSPRPGRS